MVANFSIWFAAGFLSFLVGVYFSRKGDRDSDPKPTYNRRLEYAYIGIASAFLLIAILQLIVVWTNP